MTLFKQQISVVEKIQQMLQRNYIKISVLLLAGFVWGATSVFAQNLFKSQQTQSDPTSWQFYFSENKASTGDIVEIVIAGQLEEGWYIYANDMDPDLGANIATFSFDTVKDLVLVGEVQPVGAKHKYDSTFDGETSVMYDKAEFRQKARITGKNPVVKGAIEYAACNIETGSCLPPAEKNFEVSGIAVSGKTEPKSDTAHEGQQENGETAGFDTGKQSAESPDGQHAETPADTGGQETVRQPAEHDAAFNMRSSKETKTLWGFFIVAFIGGLGALMTPCVFPLIPMTVTFFLNSSEGRKKAVVKAMVYGFSIIVIYTLIGSLIAPFLGADAANWISTNWIPNLIFFIIFLIFAFAFLGMFDIVLPSSLVNKMDKQADKGGYVGIFFMAFTLVLVTFSCTGPIASTILVESSRGAFAKPIIGMFGYSLAFALPFTLFAIFPSWLTSLPKSGGWLNSVKVVLGFLELAFAFKFISIADQAYHWGIMDRQVQLAIWIAIFATMGVYLLGKIRLPHDTPVERLSVIRLLFAIVTFSFVIYLIPGLFGAPLKPLSGLLPPIQGQDFNLYQKNSHNQYASTSKICETPKYAGFLEIPHNLKGYFDYEQGMQCAEKLDKPVFIDFTGHGCVNCRKMEENVWSDPEVLQILKEDYLIISLYVDDKTTLPEDQWYRSENDGRMKKTIGKQNADLQLRKFNHNAQPFYVLMSPESRRPLIDKAFTYNTDPAAFKKFLKEGLKVFRNNKK